jgi:hypothetical protein
MRGFFEQRFEFGEEGFEGIKVGRVKRQIMHACSCSCDGLFHARHFVAGQVIRDDDVTRLASPAVRLLSRSTAAMLRLFQVRSIPEPPVTEGRFGS